MAILGVVLGAILGAILDFGKGSSSFTATFVFQNVLISIWLSSLC